ncbi:hypothetical protein ACHAXA_009831 [Cyclostephanos tholiformis]|uniref:Uncharacterized protein n=1 Tax=Cyclostephanos tholiformis TaxID=382380 RepID=A0ABD3RAD7_9STRA
MSAKAASDEGKTKETKQQKCRYRQFVENATPPAKVKAEDIPLMEGMKIVRNELQSFSTLDSILQTIILESVGEYLCLASSFYFKNMAHQKMLNDPDSLPHSVQFKVSLSAPPSVRGSQGFKAASARADEIVKEYGLKLKDVFIDVSKLVCSELREQLLKSVAGRIPELGESLSIIGRSEGYARHRIFVDLMELHGDDIVQNIAPGDVTKFALVNAYKARHNIQDLPPKSITAPTNPYAHLARPRLSGNVRVFDQVETSPAGPYDSTEGIHMSVDGGDTENQHNNTVNAITPTAIGNDNGILSRHRLELLGVLAEWIKCIFGSSWLKFVSEEEKIVIRKGLRKLRDESFKTALAEETNAILQHGDNLDHKSLNALVTKRCKELINASKNNQRRKLRKRRSNVQKTTRGARSAPRGKRKKTLLRTLRKRKSRKEKEQKAETAEMETTLPPTYRKGKMATDLRIVRKRKKKEHRKARERNSTS